MTGKSHIAISSATTMAIAIVYFNVISLWAFALGGLFTMIPDIDCKKHGAKSFKMLSTLIFGSVISLFLHPAFSSVFLYCIVLYYSRHRTLSHSLLSVVIIYYLMSIGTAALGHPVLGIYCTIGYALHIVEDMVTVEGVPLLYPVSKMKFKIPLMRVGKISGTIIESICITASVLTCVVLILEKLKIIK